MMSQSSIDARQSLHHRMLIAALIVLTQDLSGGGGAQAWSYNYSISPNREWLEGRRWCRQHFTDMVAIQNQEETDFLNNLLPFNPSYYWIGVRKVAGVWTFVGTSENVPEGAQNWAEEEPDGIEGQDCVEVYIKRQKDMAKWNNEKCLKEKGVICYSASCVQDSCSAHADCVETIGSYTCLCHPGFFGPRCEEAFACDPLQAPEHGSHHCLHPYGSNRFNSSCLFHCELGFRLVGAPRLVCQTSGQWSHQVPLCRAAQCPVLNHTIGTGGGGGGRLSCSHPIAPHSYNSTCEVRCDEGYELSGEGQLRCDHTGQWTASVPACTIIKCPPVLHPVMGNVTCADAVEPFSFGSQCNFTCQEGYDLKGDGTLTCLASGRWSKSAPSCTVVQCNSLEAPPNAASMQCQHPLGVQSYGSTCTVVCEEGFDLIGPNRTQCSSLGEWSHMLPVCQVRPCPLLAKAPEHGGMNCSHPYSPFSFDSHCDFECNDGFWLSGTSTLRCNHSGHWSQDVPACQPVHCETIHALSLALSMNCSHPLGNFSYGSQCLFTCGEGFFINGTEALLCSSTGLWNDTLPSCTEHTPVGSAIFFYSGPGSIYLVLPFVLIALILVSVLICAKGDNRSFWDGLWFFFW